MGKGNVDKIFLGVVLTILIAGIFIFSSAAFGILAKSEAKFFSMMFNQIIFGFLGGLVAMYFFSKIPYKLWKKYSLHVLIFSIIVTLLVFVPVIGFEHGGAKRWLVIGGMTLQPSEFLKFGVVLYLAAWYSWVKNKVQDFKYGFLPLLVVLAISAGIMLKQPDTGTFLVISSAAVTIFFVAGGRLSHIASLAATATVGILVLAQFKPYLKARIMTFLDPSTDPLGSAYQIQQSLIAIGSGGLFGRGFGQSIQKFVYLPEPVGDSIFAVIGEELGFLGAITIIALFVIFALRGLRIAHKAPDTFTLLFVTGIIMLMVVQSFLNMAALIGIVPLTGVPLVFISHGGTAMLFALAEIGIILHISKYARA